MLEGFLWQIGQVFGKIDESKPARRLAKKWKLYASILRFGGNIGSAAHKVAIILLAGGVGSALLGGILDNFGGNLLIVLSVVLLILGLMPSFVDRFAHVLDDYSIQKEKSLEDLRREISEELVKLEAPVVVFIDDIDRLTDAEIKLLIQLVKANFQFPKLIFVLLFQRDIVAKALGTITSDDGYKYLRKIVQVEFDVPAASDEQAQKFLEIGVKQILESQNVFIRMDDEERERWRRIFSDDLWPYFRNLRDIKRFLGSFQFYFNLQVNKGVLEVNPIDLIAIEVLRIFDHAVYLEVGRSFLRKRNVMVEFLLDKKELSRQFSLQIDAIASGRNKEDANRLKHLLAELFPQAHGGAISSEGEWNRRLRVCHEDHFPKYFQANFDAASVSMSDFRSFLEIVENREIATSALLRMIDSRTLHPFLQFLFASREDIQLEKVAPIITALSDVSDDIPKPADFSGESDGFFDINRFIHFRLISEDPENRASLLFEAFKDSRGIIGPAKFLYTEDESARAEHKIASDFVIPKNWLDRFKTLLVERIQRAANDDKLLCNPYCGFLLYRWRNWSAPTEVRQWASRTVETPAKVIQLLPHLMSKSSTGGKIEIFFNGKAVELIIDLETLLKGTRRIAADNRTSSTGIMIDLLEKAVELKHQGKPYTEVRSQGSILDA